MHQQQYQSLAFPERTFIVQRRDNEPVAFEPVIEAGIEDLMSTAERQYHDMEAMTRGAVENWTIDTAEHVVESVPRVHNLRGELLLRFLLATTTLLHAFYP